jgi:UDP-glucose 4-epimerase
MEDAQALLGARAPVGWPPMRVVVTGGAGFLGSHLVARLLEEGHGVVALDDLSTGRRENLPAGARLVEGDARAAATVAEALEGAELVLHLAAAVGPGLVARDPSGTWSRNVEGAARVLEGAALRGARVLFVSTSEVYGPHAEGLLHEDRASELLTSARRDVYALSKAAGEAYALALSRTRLLPVTVARCFNVVGPRQSERYGMVLARFACAARERRPLTVYGDGLQRRCFLHVEDAVTALLALARTPASEGLVVNVGSDEEVKILDLARRVIEASGSKAGIEHVPFERVYGEGFVDPRRRRPDLTRLRALTGFFPARNLDDTIAATLEHGLRASV